MSVTLGGLVHAEAIENLRRLVIDHLAKLGYKVSWSHSPPYKDGDFYFWEHDFSSGNIAHTILFKENASGQLIVYIDNRAIVKVENNARFNGKFFHRIISVLKG